MIKTATIDPIAEFAIANLITNMFNKIAILDPETIQRNIEISTDNTLPISQRIIHKDLADYLLRNFAYIYAGLIVNQTFRDALKEATRIEIMFDNKYREALTKPSGSKLSSTSTFIPTDTYLVNLASYNENIYNNIKSMITQSFESMSGYTQALHQLSEALTSTDKEDIGYCISNFVYLLRAFENNANFTAIVKAIINKVKNTLQ